MATNYSDSMVEQVFRKNEGMILVCQNNEDRSFLVFGINECARGITGYDEDYLKGRDLTEIIPKDIREVIEEYVEFGEGERDLAFVLGRIRDFRLLDAEGEEVSLNLRVARSEARDQNFWYRLILRDERYEREVESFKQLLVENFKGHEVLDIDSGLPNQSSMLKDMEFAHFCAQKKGFPSCFALFRLDKYEEFRRAYGKVLALQLLRQVAANLKRNLRADDALGRIGEDTLGVILVDITQESARVVLNRLRWLVASEALSVSDMSQRTITVSVAFTAIEGDAPEKVLELCEYGLMRDPSPNVMIEK